jgi:hypothetical protein
MCKEVEEEGPRHGNKGVRAALPPPSQPRTPTQNILAPPAKEVERQEDARIAAIVRDPAAEITEFPLSDLSDSSRRRASPARTPPTRNSAPKKTPPSKASPAPKKAGKVAVQSKSPGKVAMQPKGPGRVIAQPKSPGRVVQKPPPESDEYDSEYTSYESTSS